MRPDRVVPAVAPGRGQVQTEVERLGRFLRHGLGERALEVLADVGQAVERTGQIIVFLHFRLATTAGRLVAVASRAIKTRGPKTAHNTHALTHAQSDDLLAVRRDL